MTDSDLNNHEAQHLALRILLDRVGLNDAKEFIETVSRLHMQQYTLMMKHTDLPKGDIAELLKVAYGTIGHRLLTQARFIEQHCPVKAKDEA